MYCILFEHLPSSHALCDDIRMAWFGRSNVVCAFYGSVVLARGRSGGCVKES